MQFEEGHLQIIVQQINDMLLAAGYFRSRIPGISQFDKVYNYMYIYIDSRRNLLVDHRILLQYRHRIRG